VTLPNNCECGYNPAGDKYCRLGSGHQEYVDYVARRRDLLNETSMCNAEERGVCNYYRRYVSQSFSDINQKVINARIKAEEYHLLFGADTCVRDVAFPEFVP
jgi:hypothetical protein